MPHPKALAATIGLQKKRSVYTIFYSNFFMAVSTAMIAYFLSSYFKILVGDKYVGLAFMVSYLISMVLINFFTDIIAKLGTVRSFLTILGVNFLSLLILAYGGNNKYLVVVFVIFLAANALVWVNNDVLIEMFSKDSETGRIRAVGLTMMNLGWVLTPIAAGWLISHYGFGLIFTISALLLVPPFFTRSSAETVAPGSVIKLIGRGEVTRLREPSSAVWAKTEEERKTPAKRMRARILIFIYFPYYIQKNSPRKEGS